MLGMQHIGNATYWGLRHVGDCDISGMRHIGNATYWECDTLGMRHIGNATYKGLRHIGVMYELGNILPGQFPMS